jgi:hypothetical protein
MKPPAQRILSAALALACLAHCQSSSTPGAKKDAEAEHKPTPGTKDKAELSGRQKDSSTGSSVDVAFLLSMSFTEAATMTPAKAELRGTRVCADSVEILKTYPDGSPSRIRARGRVFVELDFPGSQQARGLAQEAYISADEVILRGRPVVQRGTATLEGLTDYTVFYLFGNQIRAIGTHRATKPEQIIEEAPLGLPSWESGPNPLLPPLEPSAVPDSIRDELIRALEAENIRKKSLAPLPDGAAIPPPDSAKPTH